FSFAILMTNLCEDILCAVKEGVLDDYLDDFSDRFHKYSDDDKKNHLLALIGVVSVSPDSFNFFNLIKYFNFIDAKFDWLQSVSLNDFFFPDEKVYTDDFSKFCPCLKFLLDHKTGCNIDNDTDSFIGRLRSIKNEYNTIVGIVKMLEL